MPYYLHRLTPLHDWQVCVDPQTFHRETFLPGGDLIELPDCHWYSEAQAEANKLNGKQGGVQEVLHFNERSNMKIAEVTKREAELIHLYTEAKEASRTFAEACQYAALQAETSPAVVRRYIAALANEKANVAAHEAEQMVMLFNAIPTVTEQAA